METRLLTSFLELSIDPIFRLFESACFNCTSFIKNPFRTVSTISQLKYVFSICVTALSRGSLIL